MTLNALYIVAEILTVAANRMSVKAPGDPILQHMHCEAEDAWMNELGKQVDEWDNRSSAN